MNPPVPDELISAYFDGEVTPEERGQVENLLENSAELRHFLDDTSKLSALLHSFPRESAPESLALNVQKRVDASTVAASPVVQPVRRSLRREMTAFATGILATVASLFAVYVSINHSSSDELAAIRKAPGTPWQIAAQRVGEKDVTELSASVRNVETRTALRQESKLSDPSAASVAAPAGVLESSLSQAEALRDSVSFPNADANNFFVNGIRIEPATTEELVQQLKTGDMFSRMVLDPSNTVLVVEYTVVDVNKREDEMQVVLQTRNVPQIENEQLKRLDDGVANMKKDLALARRKRLPTRDGIVVFYVRAPGRDLASTLEHLQQHPDLYKNPETQLPIELPLTGMNNAFNLAVNEARPDAPSSDAKAANNANPVAEQPPVLVEGNIAANLYANPKGMKIDESELAMTNPRDEAISSKASSSKKKESVRDEGPPMSKSLVSSIESSKNNSNLDGGRAAIQVTSQSPQGYSFFHVAVDKELQQRQLGSQSNDPKTYPYQAPAMGNTTNPLGTGNQPFTGNSITNAPQLGSLAQMNTLTNTGMNNNGMVSQQLSRNSNSRQQAVRTNSDSRDSQMMRMLIVLKSVEPAEAAKTAP